MHIRTRDLKARAEELEDGYEEAKAEAFTREVTDEMEGMEVEEMDIDFFQGCIDSFTFPDSGDWAWSQMESEIDEIGDQQYELEKDRRMGL